jgi:hypothetical protein
MTTQTLISIKKIKKMFGLFKKDPVKKLQKQYKDLMEESYNLSTVDRKASDLKRAEAEEVLKEIDKLQEK